MSAILKVKTPTSQIWRNAYGHTCFTIRTLNLSGAKEVELCPTVSSDAFVMLTRQGEGSYDGAHRLAGYQSLKVVLFPASDIKESLFRTRESVSDRAKALGYIECSRASSIPRIFEEFSSGMSWFGLWRILLHHNPINDSEGFPSHLCITRNLDGVGISNTLESESVLQVGDAVAFFLP